MKINNTGINVAGADTINSFVESLDSISTSKAAGAVTIVSGAAFAPSTDAGYAAFVNAANAVFAVGAGNNDVFAAHDVAGARYCRGDSRGTTVGRAYDGESDAAVCAGMAAPDVCLSPRTIRRLVGVRQAYGIDT